MSICLERGSQPKIKSSLRVSGGEEPLTRVQHCDAYRTQKLCHNLCNGH